MSFVTHELLDGIASIDSNPDTAHSGEALTVSTRGCFHVRPEQDLYSPHKDCIHERPEQDLYSPHKDCIHERQQEQVYFEPRSFDRRGVDAGYHMSF